MINKNSIGVKTIWLAFLFVSLMAMPFLIGTSVQAQILGGSPSVVVQGPPVITGTDSTGLVTPGANVVVNGTNFGSGSYIKLDGSQSITPYYSSATSLSFRLPSNVTVGSHTIQVLNASNLFSNSVTITIVQGPPVIITDSIANLGGLYLSSVSSRPGLANGYVINGEGLGDTNSSIRVINNLGYRENVSNTGYATDGSKIYFTAKLTPGSYSVSVFSPVTGRVSNSVMLNIVSSIPLITVISPNGGETFTAGDVTNIRWATNNLGSLSVELDLIDKGGYIVQRIAPNIPNTGNYSWAIPRDIVTAGTSISSGAFRILASSNDKGPSAQDFSDNYFTIISANPTQTTTDLQQRIAQLQAIIAQLTAQLQALTARNGGPAPIPPTTTTTESPVTNLPRPVINSVSGPAFLAVGQQGTWSVNVTSPADVNVQYDVIWGDNLLASSAIRQRPLVPNQATFNHTYYQAGTYTIIFTVTNGQKGGGSSPSVKASVKATMTVVVGDKSTTNPSITITSPQGGVRWLRGTTHNITWNSTGNIPTVNIGIFEGSTRNWLAYRIPNTGSYAWSIPDTQLAANDYAIGVNTFDVDAGDWTRQVFSITDSTDSTPVPSAPPLPTNVSAYDFNCDGIVNINDATVISNLWRNGTPLDINLVTGTGSQCQNLGTYLGNLWRAGITSMPIDQVTAIGDKIDSFTYAHTTNLNDQRGI